MLWMKVPKAAVAAAVDRMPAALVCYGGSLSSLMSVCDTSRLPRELLLPPGPGASVWAPPPARRV